MSYTVRIGFGLGLALAAVGICAGQAGAAGKLSSGKPAVAMNAVSGVSHHPDFNGVWEVAAPEVVIRPEVNHPKHTERTKRNIEEYETRFDSNRDDPAKLCFLKGMPWTMLIGARNYPTEIYQTDQRIIMFFELYDQHRNIRLDRTAVPENYPPSANGYSYARWEGETLVVETGGLLDMNAIGQNHRSGKAHFVERWRLLRHPVYGEVIDIDITFDDPEIYLEPVKAHQILKRAPEGVVVGGYNCSSTLWDEYVERRKQELGSGKKE